MNKSQQIYYWVEPKNGKLGRGDGRIPSQGDTHTVGGRPILGSWGLHASLSPMDAFNLGESSRVWRVSLAGEVVHGEDQSCANARTYLSFIDASDVLDQFLRMCALKVIDFWDPPVIVKKYLETGNASYRHQAFYEIKTLTSKGRFSSYDPAFAAAESASWASSPAHTSPGYKARCAARWASVALSGDFLADVGSEQKNLFDCLIIDEFSRRSNISEECPE